MSRRLTAAGVAAVALAVAAQGCGAGSPGAQATAPPSPVAPAATGRSAPFVIVADTASGMAGATVPAGGWASLAFRVANRSGAPRTFTLRSSVPWLRVEGSVTVAARQSAVVEAPVRVAADAPAGIARGAVLARAEGTSGARLSVSYESSAPVVVRVVAPS